MAYGLYKPGQGYWMRVVTAAIEFFAGMRPPSAGARFAKSEPPQTIPSLESFFGLES